MDVYRCYGLSSNTTRPPSGHLALQRLLFVSTPTSLFSDLCLSSFCYNTRAGGGVGGGAEEGVGNGAGKGVGKGAPTEGVVNSRRTASKVGGDMTGRDLDGLEGGSTMTTLAIDRANNCVTRLKVYLQATTCAVQTSSVTASRLPMPLTGAVRFILCYHLLV